MFAWAIVDEHQLPVTWRACRTCRLERADGSLVAECRSTKQIEIAMRKHRRAALLYGSDDYADYEIGDPLTAPRCVVRSPEIRARPWEAALRWHFGNCVLQRGFDGECLDDCPKASELAAIEARICGL